MMDFSRPEINRPIEFMPYARRRVSDRRMAELSPAEQQALLTRGMASRSWEELEAILNILR